MDIPLVNFHSYLISLSFSVLHWPCTLRISGLSWAFDERYLLAFVAASGHYWTILGRFLASSGEFRRVHASCGQLSSEFMGISSIALAHRWPFAGHSMAISWLTVGHLPESFAIREPLASHLLGHSYAFPWRFLAFACVSRAI